MNSSKQLRFAGDVSIDSVKIITSAGRFQDITAQVLNVQLFEDIFSPFVSGSVIVKESLDLVNLMPFVGEEFVELDIKTPTVEHSAIKGKYYIYKLSDRQLVGDRSVVYQLHFISIEALIDMNKKISKTLSGNIAEIVKALLTDKANGLQTKKTVVCDPTAKTLKFISNYWSPVKCINYLSEHAINTNLSPNYVFFENRDGFYFISLDTLFKNGVKQEFVYDNYTRDNLQSTGASTRNLEKDYQRILNLTIPTGFDYIDRISSGAMSSKVVSWDAVKKQYGNKTYTMFDKFDKQEHLNKYPLSSNRAIFKANSLIINVPRQPYAMGNYADASQYKTIQERVSLMKMIESNKLQISVPGRTDYTVGQKVKVTLNKVEPVSGKDKDTEDKMFSGNYIIAAVNHEVGREMHECHMELVKESLVLNLGEEK